ncbi:RNA polymerase sigma factor [Desertivirga xinjiangensis]|uniref:RNA polymerase sigma factor n=1 Tax=Desertivirga xinjiangensis TaxID=539206 RepID=UPI00210920B1|nr:RNA polymerase sigma-70 factor [Pedobacter xinjiangensis]
MYSKTFKPDVDIILRLKNGDESAFRFVYEQCYPGLYGFAYSFLKEKQLCEEVLQETFVALWMQKDSLDTAKAIEPFLFTVCRRRILDHFRKMTSTTALKKQLMSRMSELANDTEEAVLYHDALQITNAAIERLPPQQQLVFKLSRVEGLSFDEIADRLNLSRNTVKNHLVAALKNLRLQLNEHGLLCMWLLIITR